MAQQWRVECDECGKAVSDHMRMHTQLSNRDAARQLNNDPGEGADPQGKTYVKCNVCGTIREVGT